MLATVEERMISLTAHDRCDRCGAQAYMQAESESGASELLFCRHHAQRHEDFLLSSGWVLLWDTSGMESLSPNTLQKVD